MTVTNDRLGVLLLGFAGLADDQDHQQDMYLPAFIAHPGFDVVGVADLADGGPGERLAAKLDVPFTTDWRAALALPEVDVVSVCTPQDRRVETITAAVQAGRHVLVDKPTALTAADCRQIAAAAETAGRLVVPAHHVRLNPMISAAAGAVAAGKVGLPWNVQADFVVAGGTPTTAGELTNFALYPVDVVLALTGQPVTSVYANVQRYRDEAPGPEDFAVLHLTHRHGITSTISVGRTGAIADTAPGGLAVHRYRISGSHGVLDVDPGKPAVTVRTAVWAGNGWHGPDTTNRLVAELHTAVSEQRPAVPSVADAVRVAEVLDAARASVAAGSPIDLTAEQEGTR